MPAYVYSFYCVLRDCCERVPEQEITPELLQKLSGINNYVKGLEARAELGWFTQEHILGDQSLVNKQYEELRGYLEEFVQYLPKNGLSQLLFQHFKDASFYDTVKQQHNRARELVCKLLEPGKDSSQGQNSTPLLPPLRGLNELVATKNNNNRLHLSANHELAVVFWLNNFKLDYAVHYDVFWAHLQKYLNESLTPFSLASLKGGANNEGTRSNKSKSVLFFPQFIPEWQNQSVKNKIRAIVDPENKYYVTSANCNQLFIALSEPRLLFELSDLTNAKIIKQKPFHSFSSLKLAFTWKSKDEGQIILNDFSSSTHLHKQQRPISSSNLASNAQSQAYELPKHTDIQVNGNCITMGTNSKIFHNRYPPTVRFGSLQDNQVCIKSKYVSRRQFMIIEESAPSLQGCCRDYEDSLEYTMTIARKQNQAGESKYYLVCLSPSNYTTVVYSHSIEAAKGLIFKVKGIYVQVVRVFQQCDSSSFSELDKLESQAPQPQDQEATIQSGHMLTMPPGTLASEDDSATLEHLPQSPQRPTLTHLEYMFVSGQLKNKKFVLTSHSPVVQLPEGELVLEAEGEALRVPAGTQIVVKSANEVVEGRMSGKLQLHPGTRVELEELTICVDHI